MMRLLMRQLSVLFAIIWLLSNPNRVFGEQTQVIVKGLFAGSAVLEINGQTHLIKEGKSTPEGITLLRATSHFAQIEQDGQIQKLELNRAVGGTYTEPQLASVFLGRQPDGHFFSAGRINNRWVEFMIDTGATSVTLNSFIAEQLGIDYKNAPIVAIGTAQGNTQAYQVILGSVAVGDVLLTNVSAFVIEGRFPQTILLGNTFLSRVNMRIENSAMTLQAKY
jgi:aspartyl protease family protein